MRWVKQTELMKGSFADRNPHLRIHFDPTQSEWDAALASLPVGEAAQTTAAVADSARRLCTVVAVCGLPPGGGKSTFFDSLRKLGASIERALAQAQGALDFTLTSHATVRFGCVKIMP